MSTLSIGTDAENQAEAFLKEKGFETVQKNFRYGKGEIDLIAKKGTWLVFVEVRSRSSAAFGMPEQTISKSKVSLLKKTAEAYIYKINWKGPIRFDIVSILFTKPIDIQHFEDAFF
jgi:putative endonuclease